MVPGLALSRLAGRFTPRFHSCLPSRFTSLVANPFPATEPSPFTPLAACRFLVWFHAPIPPALPPRFTPASHPCSSHVPAPCSVPVCFPGICHGQLPGFAHGDVPRTVPTTRPSSCLCRWPGSAQWQAHASQAGSYQLSPPGLDSVPHPMHCPTPPHSTLGSVPSASRRNLHRGIPRKPRFGGRSQPCEYPNDAVLQRNSAPQPIAQPQWLGTACCRESAFHAASRHRDRSARAWLSQSRFHLFRPPRPREGRQWEGRPRTFSAPLHHSPQPREQPRPSSANADVPHTPSARQEPPQFEC